MRWPWQQKSQVTSTVSDNRSGWWPWIREPFAGAWQRNIEWTVDSVLAHPTVYACVTLIAADVAKMRTKLVEEVGPDLWTEVTSSAFSPVLRKPNRFQNHIQFKKNWIVSKLSRGNTYVLKERDQRGVVKALYVLDPARVTVLVAPDGSVFYQLCEDNLSGLQGGQVSVPASEIIHDRCTPLFHPLVGVPPLFAGGSSASVGLEIQRNAGAFFANGSNPSGIITGPETIPDSVAVRLKEHWESEYTGANSGRVAVLGNALKFQGMRMTSVDAQMTEHDKAIDLRICSAFRVPAFMVNVGPVPALQNAEILTRQYYSTCLQDHAVEYEVAMDEGLGIGYGVKVEGRTLGVELDKDALLQMDTASQITTLVAGIRGGLFTPNEARRKVDQLPLEGGDTIYLQHQDYPIEQVFNRTDLDAPPEPAATPPSPSTEEPEVEEEEARAFFERRFETRWRQAA